MNFATTKERIIQYIDFKGIKIKDFYEKTGIKRGFLDSDKLKSSVSDVFLAIIFANFNDVNPIWLITGEGSMLKDTEVVLSSSQPQENDNNEIVSLLKDKISLLEKNNALLEKENAYQAKEILLLEKEVSNLKKQTKSPTPAKVLEI